MSVALAALEVMDKEPPLWFVLFGFVSIGTIGMLAARRRPILCGPFIAAVLLGAFALYSESSIPYVGESIIREGGFVYLAGCGVAILAGIGMPLFGAFAGATKLGESAAGWRWISGAAGGALLGLTLLVGSGFVESAYNDYIFYPIEKAGEGYIMPLRWQDIVAELSIAFVLIGLFLLSVYLMHSALRPKATKTLRISANS
jgi:hypothetical protein